MNVNINLFKPEIFNNKYRQIPVNGFQELRSLMNIKTYPKGYLRLSHCSIIIFAWRQICLSYYDRIFTLK